MSFETSQKRNFKPQIVADYDIKVSFKYSLLKDKTLRSLIFSIAIFRFFLFWWRKNMELKSNKKKAKNCVSLAVIPPKITLFPASCFFAHSMPFPVLQWFFVNSKYWNYCFPQLKFTLAHNNSKKIAIV